MLYDYNCYRASGPRVLSGASLSQFRRRMSPAQRAVLGADILDGRVVLQGLTVKAIAELVGANESYVFAALRCSPEQREEVKRGQRPLIKPQTRGVPTPTTIDWAQVDDKSLVDGARLIGADRMLAAAVAAEHVATSN